MFNQIRAEFYKLFHTKALYLTFALILAVFGIFSIGGQQQFVASSSSLDETWKIEFYDLSVIENEQVDVECERVDINRIVTDCLIEKYYEFGEIQPTIQTENTPVWIYGNNLICKRIIENLIVNALRYSDNYIEVSINQKGVFTIKNSTKSLDDIDVNLLFNKFYTVDKSRTKGSSGLGLYIVKELLKKIDGKIENISYEKNILSISICFPLYNDKKLL